MFTEGKNDSYPCMGNIKKSISGNLTLGYMGPGQGSLWPCTLWLKDQANMTKWS
jgi:hypothetical protein